MKIGNPAEKPVPTALGNNASTATSASVASASAATAGNRAIPTHADASAKIQLSSTVSNLLTAGSSPEFDAEKVARMSKSIEDGTFKVNHGAIADKLIANAKEVLGKVQS